MFCSSTQKLNEWECKWSKLHTELKISTKEVQPIEHNQIRKRFLMEEASKLKFTKQETDSILQHMSVSISCVKMCAQIWYDMGGHIHVVSRQEEVEKQQAWHRFKDPFYRLTNEVTIVHWILRDRYEAEMVLFF